ncbi:MAG: hypothetical protein A3F89_02105 [Deltaproteobacteria bacterium RIFCSPLOWO2_12_FULL_50_11]|nr:MAG: hypothetical protein A2053_04540 [Deltaproteobacteria bacterium GWA2_50_8]OGQ67778.1 MAG: hypothetical protein A3F89_02105 [Deltaproteobacteria bacterium RIFCSPLOWO2_12_FULL_50_11]
MKKIIIPFAIFALFIANSLEAATIKVWHEMHDNAPSAVNAEGILKASPNAIWETLIRFNDFAKFMPRVRESFFITQEGVDALKKTKTNHINKIQEIARLYKTDDHRLKGGKWEGFVFMVLNTPFPVTNRWYILHTIHDESEAFQDKFYRCWNLVFGNIENAQGCWYLQPAEEPSHTFARYQDSIHPGGNVPRWAARMGATQTIPQMFKNLESEVLRIQNQ